MNDNKQDRPPSEGQQGIDRETEQRNRENETGQAQGQQDDQPPTGEADTSAFGQPGQSAGGDTTLSERTGQTAGLEPGDTGASPGGTGPQGSSGFVGSGNDNSSDYVTKGEENQDFAAQGQGAQDTEAGKSDIETGQAQDRDSNPDDGSDTSR